MKVKTPTGWKLILCYFVLEQEHFLWFMHKYFWIVLLLPVFSALAQQKELMFENYTSEQGLSSNWVRDIDQDSLGYMWMATNDGLNRFDGYRFKVYRKEEGNPRSLPSHFIRCMHVDRGGKLWVGFNGGLSEYIKETDDFTNYTFNPNNPSSLPSNKIADVTSDSKNTLWIITREYGLCKYNSGDYSFTRTPYPQAKTGDFNKMYCDSKDRIWIATNGNGLICYDIKSGKYEGIVDQPAQHVTYIFEDSNKRLWIGTRDEGLGYVENGRFIPSGLVPKNQIIASISEDSHKQLWVSVENQGVMIMDPANVKLIRNITHSQFAPYGLSHNSINSFLLDRDNNFWIGTFAQGVNLLKEPNNLFGHHFHNPVNSNTLSYDATLSFLEDKEGLWIGTDNGGLNFVDNKTKQFRHFNKKNTQLPSDVILSLALNGNDKLWVGTYQAGLVSMDKKSGRCESLLPKESIGSLAMDEKNKILWIGTWGSGIFKYDVQARKITQFKGSPEDPKTLNDNFIFYVYMDKANRMWCCTSTGLHLLENAETGAFRRFVKDPDNVRSIVSNTVYDCFEDAKGRFWIGTSEGLCLMSRDSLNFTRISPDKFSNENILCIQDDEFGNLWISTNKGLNCYNHETGQVRIYGKKDGLQSDQFSNKAQAKLSTGEIIFGGVNGYNRFFPKDFVKLKGSHDVMIQSFWVLDSEVPVSKEKTKHYSIPFHISLLNEVQMPDDLNSVRFEFVSLDYNNAERLNYAYMLEGFDTDWRIADQSRIASYTNLDPGTYRLKIKCWLFGETQDRPVKELIINIKHPFWQTWWFIGLMLIAGGFAVYQLYKLSVSALKRRQVMLEDKVKERTRQIEKQKEQIEHLYLELEDSIDAAKTIQYNLLPADSMIRKMFKDHFLKYLPKHKVSGDFYWLKEKNGKVYFALIDCTGHGVPGAFLTMIASDKLNHLLDRNHTPNVANLLNQLNDEVVNTLRHPENDFHMDGMDIALCEFDPVTRVLRFAGSRMSIIIYKNREFTTIKGHRFSIGTHKNGAQIDFSVSEIQLEAGSRIFLFTDGYTDQLGGEQQQKLLVRRVQTQLEATIHKPLQEQGEALVKNFDDWRGDMPQLDDVTLWLIEV